MNELEYALQEAYENGLSEGYNYGLNEIADTWSMDKRMRVAHALVNRNRNKIYSPTRLMKTIVKHPLSFASRYTNDSKMYDRNATRAIDRLVQGKSPQQIRAARKKSKEEILASMRKNISTDHSSDGYKSLNGREYHPKMFGYSI